MSWIFSGQHFQVYPETLGTMLTPASVLFFSLNELEIDTILFFFLFFIFLLIRSHSMHKSLNILLSGSIFFYAAGITQK